MAMYGPVQEFFKELATKNYEKLYVQQNKTEQEVNEANLARAVRYASLVSMGITSYMWSDTKDTLEKISVAHPLLGLFCSIYCTFALLSMCLGAIAAALPDFAPCYLEFASNGVLQGFIFVMFAFHLETVNCYPESTWFVISLLVTISAIIVYWCRTAEEPRVALVIVRFVGCIFGWIWNASAFSVVWIGAHVINLFRRVPREATYPPPRHIVPLGYEALPSSPSKIIVVEERSRGK